MAIRPIDLISPRYLEMQRVLHAAPRGYGGRGDKWAGVVMQIAAAYGCTSILDYGCGQGSLAKALRAETYGTAIRVDEYDPAIPGKDYPPSFADLVNVTDVLEHIEPERLETVLAHIRMLARKVIWCVVSTKTSNKFLADGRNAHLIVKPAKWWKQQFLVAGFTLHRPPSIVREIPEREWSVVLTP